MHKEHPRPHGPYHKLAYVHRGKPVCRFVRAACADEIKERLASHKVFRKLIERWIELSIQQAKIEFFSQSKNPKPKRQTSTGGASPADCPWG